MRALYKAAKLPVGHPKRRAILASEQGKEKLLLLLGILRAMHWFHWTAHWVTYGHGNHLLLERLYDGEEDDGDGIQGEVDALAEKIVGFYGAETVDALDTMTRATYWIRRWTEKQGTPIAKALQAEQDFQIVVKATYEAVKKLPDMTLGLDDFIMSMANDHEVNLYLLQQANRN